VAIECSGGPGTLAACIGAVRAGGRVTQTALPHRPVEIDVNQIVARDVTITGRQAYPVTS
jgi:threonine dehydrogenase-like Zn-dependent dehydrogenase